MELRAVLRQIFVFDLRVADAGVQVQDAHGLQPVGKGFVQHPAHAAFLGIVIQIDGQLTGPVVGSTAHKRPGIGVALNAPVLLDDEIGIFFHGAAHPALKLGQRRDRILKGNDSALDVIGINFQNTRRIGQRRIADGDLRHKDPSFL